MKLSENSEAVKNSIRSEKITKDNELFTFEIPDVDPGYKYSVELISENLVDNITKNINIKGIF